MRIAAYLLAASLLPAECFAAAHEMTPTDVEAFIDGIVPQQLRRDDIAGAVVCIVRDGKIFFAKGYGFADVASRKPVTPDATLFRPGSVSKLFTWTSVMQLVEAGKIDLDRDVNAYLDFRIPAAFGRPITMRNIMTHTSGLEETDKELFVPDVKDLKPLDMYLKTHLPRRIFPPGVTPAYSNYATALAGYIVQRLSGQPYDDYVETHILKPLGMTHTTFRQPLPADLKPLMSTGYRLASSPPLPYEVVQAWPAGSSAVTATDMARMMIAHLQDGRYGDVQILRPETARLMHSPQFRYLPQLHAMCLGFYEETRNGRRIIGHAGDTVAFHTDLHLMPDANLGFFVSYNSAGKGGVSARTELWNAFLDRYFPYEPPAAPTLATAASDARTVSGTYITSRRSETTLVSVITLAGEAHVSTNSDNTISVDSLRDPNGKPKRFGEIAPLLFREVRGQALVGFKRDDSGRLTLASDFPVFVFQRAPLSKATGFNLMILIGSLCVIVLAIVLWPIAALMRRHYGRPLKLSRGSKFLRIAVRVVCIIDVAFAASWLALVSGLNDPAKLNASLDPKLRLIELIGWLGVLGMLLALYNGVRSWRSPNWWGTRAFDTVIALACVGLTWFIFNWHMLAWSLNY